MVDLSIAIPLLVLLVPVLFLVGRYIDRTYIRTPAKTGFGRGAPGFQTSVRRIAVPRAVQPEEPRVVRTKSGGVYSEDWIPQQHLQRQGSGNKNRKRK